MGISIDIGKTPHGQSLTWTDAPNPHAYVSGCSGQGKSFFLRKLITQLPQQGVRCVIFDCSHDWTGLGRCVDQAYPPAEVVDVKSTQFAINPLRPLLLTEQWREDESGVAFRLAELLRVAYRLHGSQEMNVNDTVFRFLCSGERPKTIGQMIQYIERDKELKQRMGSVITRLRTLIRTVNCLEREYGWDFSTPGVTVLDFSRITTESQQALIVELVLGSLWSQRLERSASQRVPLVVVLDECQKFRFYSNSFLVKVLREGRKYNFAGWFCSQWIDDKVAVQALEQAAFRAYFRPESNQIHKLARRLGGEDKRMIAQYEKALSGLRQGRYLYQTKSSTPIIASVGC